MCKLCFDGRITGKSKMSKIILNSSASPVTKLSPTGECISKTLMKAVTKLKATFMSDDGSRVDYSRMAESDEFGEYCDTVGLLQDVRQEQFSQEKVCLYINIMIYL